MNIDKYIEGVKAIKAGTDLLDMGNSEYWLRRLGDVYKFAQTLAPHQPGSRVRLIVDPNINEKTSWGWMPYRHFVKVGATAVVRWVEVDGDGFRYYVVFDEDCWKDDRNNVVHPTPEKDRGVFGFAARCLEAA